MNVPLSERRMLAGDAAQFSSSLPAPPRVSNLLPPPPRIGSDSRDRDSIGTRQHDRSAAHTPGSRLLPDNATTSGRVMGGGQFPQRQNQHGTRDRHTDRLSSGRGSRSPYIGRERHIPPDKWRYRRAWHHPDRDRNYSSRRRQHASGESARYSDDMGEDGLLQTDDASIDQLHDDDTSLPVAAELPSQTVSLSNDKDCNDVSSSSAVSHSETVPPS